MKTKLFLSLSLLTAAFTAINADLALPVFGPHSDIAQAELSAAEALKQTVIDHKFKHNMKRAFTSSLPYAKLAGLTALSTGAIVMGYKHNHDAKAAEALANRSYTEKFMDGVSHYAQVAKANTWDKELFGYKQGGKVATTVAGVAAVAGLSYLAYKKNPFGKAVVKIVAPKVVTPVAKRKLSVI